MATLKLPLSFSPVGGFAEVLFEDQVEFYGQAIRMAIAVEPGELFLDPSFGSVDPTFTDREPVGFRSTLSSFWPEIAVANFSVSDARQSGDQIMRVQFEVT